MQQSHINKDGVNKGNEALEYIEYMEQINGNQKIKVNNLRTK